MSTIPIGAFCAGRHWYNGAVFLTYGGAVMMAFVGGMENGAFYSPYSAETIAANWACIAAGVAILAAAAGRAGNTHYRIWNGGRDLDTSRWEYPRVDNGIAHTRLRACASCWYFALAIACKNSDYFHANARLVSRS
jgi:hypothetical protein